MTRPQIDAFLVLFDKCLDTGMVCEHSVSESIAHHLVDSDGVLRYHETRDLLISVFPEKCAPFTNIKHPTAAYWTKNEPVLTRGEVWHRLHQVILGMPSVERMGLHRDPKWRH